MASLSGWTLIIIGGVVGVWSYFQPDLLFFTIVGGVMALYGISKVIYARAFRKSESPQLKNAPIQARAHANPQMHAHTAAQAQHAMQMARQGQTQVQQKYAGQAQHQVHANAQVQQQTHARNVTQQQAHHANMHQPQTAYKICPNCKKHMHVTYRFCPSCGWGV